MLHKWETILIPLHVWKRNILLTKNCSIFACQKKMKKFCDTKQEAKMHLFNSTSTVQSRQTLIFQIDNTNLYDNGSIVFFLLPFLFFLYFHSPEVRLSSNLQTTKLMDLDASHLWFLVDKLIVLTLQWHFCDHPKRKDRTLVFLHVVSTDVNT